MQRRTILHANTRGEGLFQRFVGSDGTGDCRRLGVLGELDLGGVPLRYIHKVSAGRVGSMGYCIIGTVVGVAHGGRDIGA